MSGLLVGIGFTVLVMFFYTREFRKIINGYAFKDMDSGNIKAFLKSQTLRQKMFMTYITKCTTTRKQDAALMVCMLMFHFIHVLVCIAFLSMLLGEAFYMDILNRTIDASAYVVGTITYGALGSWAFRLVIFIYPVCFLVALIYEVVQKKKEKQ